MWPPSEMRPGGAFRTWQLTPESPFLLPVAGAAGLDAGLKTEPADGGSGIPRRAIRRCRMRGVQLERNKPLQAPETADGTAAPDVAAPLAAGFAAYGGLAPMFIPPLTGVCILFGTSGVKREILQ